MHKILAIISQSPYHVYAIEQQQMIWGLASLLEDNLTVLFILQGVWHLRHIPNNSSFIQGWQAYEHFGLHHNSCFYCAEDWLEQELPVIPATPIRQENLSSFLASFTTVIQL